MQMVAARQSWPWQRVVLLKPFLQKGLSVQPFLSGKTPRLFILLGKTGRGLRCALSGNLALFPATVQGRSERETAVRQRTVSGWENLLDLSHNVYPTRYHLPAFCRNYIDTLILDSLIVAYFLKRNGVIQVSNLSWKGALYTGAGTFFLAVTVGFSAQFFLRQNVSILLSFALLILIILIGIVFDIIGVAAAAASEVPLHARASKKVHGARQALRLVRHADRVANFCSDVIGDVAGTLSGAVGASIVLRLWRDFQGGEGELIFSILMTAAVAALTVGGKALGKSLAINESTEILLQVGLFQYWAEKTLGLKFLAGRRSKPGKGRSR